MGGSVYCSGPDTDTTIIPLSESGGTTTPDKVVLNIDGGALVGEFMLDGSMSR
jgi:hypothetical protein